jgi:predicted nucleic acid-binding Zn ribbon protein
LKKKHPEHIGSVLKQLFRDRDWEENIKVSVALFRWQEIVGLQIASQSQPEFLKDGVLQVRVENSVWLNHLRFLEEELLQKLNKQLPSLEIKEIRFRQGPLDAYQSPPSSTETKATPTAQRVVKPPSPLSPEQQKLLEEIPDAELRRDLTALLKKQKGHSRT